jgi:hypothetical protein
LLVLFVMVASAFDSLFTLIHLENGWREANPFMALALEQGSVFFVYVKMVVTAIGGWLLAVHQQFPLAFTALHMLALAYLVLSVLHIAFLLH